MDLIDARERGAALAAAAGFLLIPPDGASLEALFALAGAAGLPVSAACRESAADVGAARRRFHERVAVACAPVYAPLWEQAIRDARYEGGAWVFSVTGDAATRRVSAAYRAAGFDWERLALTPAVRASVHPDSLGVECAFAAFLLGAAASTVDASAAGVFLRAHPARWAAQAARIARDGGDDWYALAVAMAALSCEDG